MRTRTSSEELVDSGLNQSTSWMMMDGCDDSQATTAV